MHASEWNFFPNGVIITSCSASGAKSGIGAGCGTLTCLGKGGGGPRLAGAALGTGSAMVLAGGVSSLDEEAVLLLRPTCLTSSAVALDGNDDPPGGRCHHLFLSILLMSSDISIYLAGPGSTDHASPEDGPAGVSAGAGTCCSGACQARANCSPARLSTARTSSALALALCHGEVRGGIRAKNSSAAGAHSY